MGLSNMNQHDDRITVYLTCRRYLYELLQHVFGNEPSKGLLDILTSNYTQEVLRLFLDEIGPQINEHIELLDSLKSEMVFNLERLLDELSGEYTYLFIGPKKLPAPPWESVYISKQRLIFQESTLIVRRAYLEYQFLPANYPHEADDHLALELDFMAHLAKNTEERYKDQNLTELRELLSDQKSFLEEHLLIWIPEFAQQIQSSKSQFMYPQIAKLTDQVINIDRDTLDELFNLLFPNGS